MREDSNVVMAFAC